MNATSLTRVKQTVEILEESIQRLQATNTVWSQALIGGFQFEYILNLALILELPKARRKEAAALFDHYRQVILPTQDRSVRRVAAFMQLFGVSFTAKILAAAKWMKRKRERRIP